jgi:hypothetical protein
MNFVIHLVVSRLELNRLLRGVEDLAIPLNEPCDRIVSSLSLFHVHYFFLEFNDDLLELSNSIFVQILLCLELSGGGAVELLEHESLHMEGSTSDIISSTLASRSYIFF